MVTPAEIQTCSSIITIGSVSIFAAAFLSNQQLLKEIVWYINPVTIFMLGGLFLIMAGSSLLLYYHDNSRQWAVNIYDLAFITGLFFIVAGAIESVFSFIFTL